MFSKVFSHQVGRSVCGGEGGGHASEGKVCVFVELGGGGETKGMDTGKLGGVYVRRITPLSFVCREKQTDLF